MNKTTSNDKNSYLHLKLLSIWSIILRESYIVVNRNFSDNLFSSYWPSYIVGIFICREIRFLINSIDNEIKGFEVNLEANWHLFDILIYFHLAIWLSFIMTYSLTYSCDVFIWRIHYSLWRIQDKDVNHNS